MFLYKFTNGDKAQMYYKKKQCICELVYFLFYSLPSKQLYRFWIISVGTELDRTHEKIIS